MKIADMVGGLVAALAIAASAAMAEPDSSTLIMDGDQVSGEIVLKPEQILDLRFEVSFATGRRWSAIVSGNAVKFEKSSQIDVPATANKPIRQQQSLTFLALSPGSAKIVLSYGRPWRSSEAEKINCLTITVR
jgi:predicted secreted protein